MTWDRVQLLRMICPLYFQVFPSSIVSNYLQLKPIHDELPRHGTHLPRCEAAELLLLEHAMQKSPIRAPAFETNRPPLLQSAAAAAFWRCPAQTHPLPLPFGGAQHRPILCHCLLAVPSTDPSSATASWRCCSTPCATLRVPEQRLPSGASALGTSWACSAYARCTGELHHHGSDCQRHAAPAWKPSFAPCYTVPRGSASTMPWRRCKPR